MKEGSFPSRELLSGDQARNNFLFGTRCGDPATMCGMRFARLLAVSLAASRLIFSQGVDLWQRSRGLDLKLIEG